MSARHLGCANEGTDRQKGERDTIFNVCFKLRKHNFNLDIISERACIAQQVNVLQILYIMLYLGFKSYS